MLVKMLIYLYNLFFRKLNICTCLAIIAISSSPSHSKTNFDTSEPWIKIGCGYINHVYNATCNPTQEKLDISCEEGFRLECQEIYLCSPPDNPFKTSCRCVPDAGCGITVTVNGLCGSANNVPTAIAPAADLCSFGTPTPLSGSGPWTWQCMGEGGGLTVSCSASIPPPPPPPSFGGTCPK